MRCHLVLLFILICSTSQPAKSAELLMFEEDWCPWCERWNDEVGVIYAKTPEGRLAPLRRVDIHGAFPEGLDLESRPRYTPTFILTTDGREIARIEGYPGADFFWGLLGRMLKKLPQPDPDPAVSGTGDQS